jgi:hypothetical protein
MTSHESEHTDDAELVARIAPALRAPEFLDGSFEARVMAAIEGDAARRATRASAQSWWRRPHTIEITPLASLALAAGLVVTVLSSAYAFQTAFDTRPVVVAAAHDTVHMVRFVFVDRGARSVSLVGDFNAWTKDATKLEPAGGDGAWSVSVALPPGRHEYAFVVDGKRWASDPFADSVHDEHGTESSVVRVSD